jgi:membrane fusion protein, hemolysin D
MRETLNDKGALSRALVIDSLQQYEAQATTQVSERGQLAEALASLITLERKLDETVTQFIADQMQKLAEAERKADRLEQELIKAQSKNERAKLRAPIAGTVQQLAVTTVGQVVTTGQALMTIVPFDSPIEIEVMIQNKDIGFVEPGQPAAVKIESFPFTRYGTIAGTVLKVSRDAVDEREASALSDPGSAVKPQGSTTAAAPPKVQALVFPATIGLARRFINVDGKDIPLSAGMSVSVEIRTGQRRAIDYVLSPLREVAAASGHER